MHLTIFFQGKAADNSIVIIDKAAFFLSDQMLAARLATIMPYVCPVGHCESFADAGFPENTGKYDLPGSLLFGNSLTFSGSITWRKTKADHQSGKS